MRLITHNILACHAKGCNTNNFPLRLQNVTISLRESEYSEEFLRNFLPRLEWAALTDAARQLGDESLPEMVPDDEGLNDEFLRKLHHVLFEIEVDEGEMVCPNCEHIYPISNTIPNMLLNEQEVA